MENKVHSIISTVRLLNEEFPGVFVDLIFNATGIESEIVSLASVVEILPGLRIQVASISCLIAMKILSSRNKQRKQDLLDLENLIKDANRHEITEALSLIKKIEDKGFNQSKNLTKIFDQLLKDIQD